MPYQNLEVAIEERVATVSMAKTENMNALSLAFTAEIAQAFRDLGANDEVRVIVLASKAKAFCAGLDLKEFAAVGLKGSAKSSLEFPEKLRALFDCCDGIEACPKPVIAAVNGLCIGGGLDIVSACDIRLCTEGCFLLPARGRHRPGGRHGRAAEASHVIGQGFTREWPSRLVSTRQRRCRRWVSSMPSSPTRPP
jgi:enoyl-CoA hydratase